MAFYLLKLIPPRPSFAQDMSPEERGVMMQHVGYWTKLAQSGTAVLFGPVLDPAGAWGVGIVEAQDDAAVHSLTAKDPAALGNIGMTYQVLPMAQAILRSSVAAVPHS